MHFMHGKGRTMSEEEIKVKGELLVRCCPGCSVQFDEPVLTNKWHKCPVCESEFLCRINPASKIEN